MFLGLDLGTTNVKAVVASPEGQVLARGSAPVRLDHLGSGAVEQDIEEIFQARLAAMELVSAAADTSAVKAIGVSAQGGALQLLDGQDRPVGRVVSWLDARGKPEDERIKFVAWLGRSLLGYMDSIMDPKG